MLYSFGCISRLSDVTQCASYRPSVVGALKYENFSP